MALKSEDTVCFCFHVPLRKIEQFCQREKPQAASQISDCLSAGTGCGWCVPMLRKIHGRLCGSYEPWWRAEPESGESQDETADEDGGKPKKINADAKTMGNGKIGAGQLPDERAIDMPAFEESASADFYASSREKYLERLRIARDKKRSGD